MFFLVLIKDFVHNIYCLDQNLVYHAPFMGTAYSKTIRRIFNNLIVKYIF